MVFNTALTGYQEVLTDPSYRGQIVAMTAPQIGNVGWNPEDTAFWATTGRRVARRNLIFSIFAEHLGFSVWALWSVIVVALPPKSFPFILDVDKKFWLVAIPNLVGAVLRVPYTLAVPRFGGRNWTVVSALLLLIPISIAFAILRSRLWDIDIIISRTLVYGSLTAILTVIYFASVIALQSLLGVFTGQLSAGTQTPVVIVASTLGIAALFQPLRRFLQTIIDRRFYRSRYDAARTLAAFSASLRNEVDLNQLREQLLAVVQETMQPAHVSLWLRPPEQSGQRHTRLLPRIDEEESVAP